MIKKKWPFMVLFLILSFFSIRAVLAQGGIDSVKELIELAQSDRRGFLVLSGLCAAGFILFEGLAIAVLARGIYDSRHTSCGIVYGAADVYFSAITPSATGGQPASAFFMIWDGIPTAGATVILLVNLIMYTYALMLAGFFAILACPQMLFQYEGPGSLLILLGIAILFILGASFRMLLKRPEFVRHFLYLCIRLAKKLHLIRETEHKKQKADLMIDHYEECASVIRGKQGLLFICFLFNLLQRISQSFVTVFVYLSQGGRAKEAVQVWCVHIYTSLGSNSIPIPGAIGVSDYLLLKGLSFLPDVENPAGLAFLSRGLYFYVCILLSVLILLIGYARRKRRTIKLSGEK